MGSIPFLRGQQMNKSKETDYEFLPQLFLRTPYYSFNGYDLSRLPEVLQDQAFCNAVWLASPGFYRVLEAKEFDYNGLKDKEKHTLSKYYNRMCFRPTPFGSFASFTLLEWGNGGQVKLVNNSKALLHLLPDQQLNHQVRTAPDNFTRHVNLIASPSLYRMDNVFRYTKSSITEKGKYNYSLEAIAAVKFNVDLFASLSKGPVCIAKMIGWIEVHGECTTAEAVDYLRFLLDEQALYSNSQGYMIDGGTLENFPQLTSYNHFWKVNSSIFLDIKFSLAELAAQLKQLIPGIIKKSNIQPFYAALERQVESGGPDQAEQIELSGAIDLLALLAVHQQPDDLSRFIREFRERFDREKVPLLIALDPDAGLPYGNLQASNPDPGVLENINFPEAEPANDQLAWNAVQQLLFKLWIGDTLRDPWSPLQIREEDIRELRNRKKDVLHLPNTQAIMYRNTGEHLIIEHAGGVTAASLIGRFSCFSDAVHNFCRRLADLEINANPGIAFADIGALSDTHVDNINRRKSIYPYEIPINVYPAQPDKTQLRPDDLLLSVQGDELILESLSLGKRVIPRLATAYNFRNNHLPVFRLLCDLQFQGLKAGLSFDLESLFPGLPFYPRLSFGRVVISPARWNFKEPELTVFVGKDPGELSGQMQAFRRKYHIPRHISMGTYDQQLVFDLAFTSEAHFFLQCIKGMKSVTVQEYFMPDRSVLAGKKPLAGQFVAFLAHDKNIYPANTQVKNVATRNYGRSFMMGSNWLYLKIFCTPRAAETILSKVIRPFISSQRKRIKNWFFIRYTDKGYHLRLRIQADESDLGALLVALNKKMVSTGYDKLVRDYQGDTYRREIERYSLRLIPQVEDIFCSGSELVAWFVNAKGKNTTKWTDFELALLSADMMIGCFLETDEIRLYYLDAVTGKFMEEFRADKQLKTGLDTKYREMKAEIAVLLESEIKVKEFWGMLKQVSVLASLTGNYSSEKRSSFLADIVHMQLNRTFSIQQRQQELLVYYCLQKDMLSRMARKKTANYSV